MTYATLPDVDYTALIAETQSYLTANNYVAGENFPIGPVTPLLLSEIPSIETTFAHLNLTVRELNVICYPADTGASSDKKYILVNDLLIVPMSTAITGSSNIFEADIAAELLFDSVLGGPYYNSSDCTQVDSIVYTTGSGFLIKTDTVSRFEGNTAECMFIFINFNEDVSEYFTN